MKLRIPFLVLVIAATGACGPLVISTARAETRTGTASVNVTPHVLPAPFSVSDTVLWDVSRGSYYSSLYPDHDVEEWGGMVGTAEWTFYSSGTMGSFTLFQANNGNVTPFAKVQFYTGPLELSALVDANQTFSPNARPAINGGEIKRFGYSVTMPEAPTPLFGWVELDGSASTLGNLVVNATWAYDTTGAPITVGTVPEPTTLVLVGLGCMALLARCRFRRKQS